MNKQRCNCYLGKIPFPGREEEIEQFANLMGFNYYEAMLKIGEGYKICPDCKGTGYINKT
ncbi:hypothetical protein [Niallia endozanthoxylica]|uniref:Uncharacterized protein n=1 Tax=Niallia endozanthoxylica TaxID=2036016 RepID=A0A5J5HRE3_9BACI|nr:hypothetical protein [Niallia endozanthoxylica]KAA9022308.1 hypothetical protein F4V44_15695 [Niallia endozanthoxylica]